MTTMFLNITAYLACILCVFCLLRTTFQVKKPKFPYWTSLITMSCLIGSLYWHSSFWNNEILSYLVLLAGQTLLLKLFIHLNWCQAVFAGIFDTLHLICIKGITIGIVAVLLRKNLYQVITNPRFFLLVLLVTMLLQSFLYWFYGRFLDRKKFQLLFNLEAELESVVLQHGALFVFMLFYSYNYYYNLDLVWFSLAQTLLSLLILVLYFLILSYGTRVSYLLEHDIHNELLRQQLKLQLSQYSSYQQMLSEIETFKYHFRERILSLEQLLEEGDTSALKTAAHTQVLPLLNLLPAKKTFSNNEFINAVLLDWEQQCARQQIAFHCLLFVPDMLKEHQEEIADILYRLRELYQHLTLCHTNGSLKLEGRHIQSRLVLQVSGSYRGSISQKKDLPCFETPEGLQTKSAYHRLSDMLEAFDGTLFWDTDPDTSQFLLTLSIRF